MKTVIEMAHETLERMKADEHCREQYWSATDDELQAFAELVRADERNRTWTQEHWTEYERSIAAAEREACAKVCDELRGINWGPEQCATAIRARMAEQSAQQEPVALEKVYETIIQWDEGGGKRSRRELARRIVALYTRPQAREPLSYEELGKLVSATPWRQDESMHTYAVRACRAIEAAHGIKENT